MENKKRAREERWKRERVFKRGAEVATVKKRRGEIALSGSGDRDRGRGTAAIKRWRVCAEYRAHCHQNGLSERKTESTGPKMNSGSFAAHLRNK